MWFGAGGWERYFGKSCEMCFKGRAEVDRWHLASGLSEVMHVEVDLVDLRRASAVMRVQVLDNSRLLFEGDAPERMRFERFARSDYARLNEERRAILDDVRVNGSVLG
jgi:hypothetical protein